MRTYKHNIVYKTTNKINGKWYIGVHSTDDIKDKYLGSGIALKLAIDKYGRNNFTREILYDYPNVELAYIKEAEMVNIDVCKSNDNYNLMTGGVGGQYLNNITKTHINTKQGWVLKEEFDPSIHNGHNKDIVIVKDSSGNQFAVSKSDPRYLSGELIPWNRGLKKSKEGNLKRSETQKAKPKYPKIKCECGQLVTTQPAGYKAHINGSSHLKKI